MKFLETNTAWVVTLSQIYTLKTAITNNTSVFLQFLQLVLLCHSTMQCQLKNQTQFIHLCVCIYITRVIWKRDTKGTQKPLHSNETKKAKKFFEGQNSQKQRQHKFWYLIFHKTFLRFCTQVLYVVIILWFCFCKLIEKKFCGAVDS